MSVHGGNRLGANSLLDTLIFGRRSGEHASGARGADGDAQARARAAARHRRARRALMTRSGGRRVSEIRDELGDDDEREGRGVPRRGGAHGGARTSSSASRRRPRAPRSTIAARSSTRTCSARWSWATCSTIAECIVVPRSSARSRAARSSEPTSPSATTTSGSSTSMCMNGATAPAQHSPIKITKWEPQERKY